MFRFIRFSILCCALAVPTIALAENQQVTVEGDLITARHHLATPGVRTRANRPRAFSALEPIHLSTTLPDGRTAQIALTSMVQRYWDAYFVSDAGITPDQSELTLFRGEAQVDGQSVPLAGSIYIHDGVPTLFADFTAPEGTTFFGLEIPLDGSSTGSSAKLEVTRKDQLPPMACGADDEAQPDVAAPPVGQTRSTRTDNRAWHSLDVATEADFEFYSRYGTESNNRISTIINKADVATTANAIYRSQLKVDLRIKTQQTITSASNPFTATASSTLLTQFLTYTNTNNQLGSANAYYLISGKDFDGSVIGTAYLSVVCASPSFSYGVVQDIGSLTYLVFAHELGHNLGAEHDLSGVPSIMGPALSGAVTAFSAFSVGQLQTFIDNTATCLPTIAAPDGGPSPTPTPTPTPPSGGGGGGISNPNPTPTPTPTPTPNATVSLGASFDLSSSRFTAVVTAGGASAADCQATLAISTDVTMVNAQTVAWGKTGSVAVRGSAKNKKRTSTGPSMLFVQAGYACPSIGVSVSSDVQSISVGNASKAKQVTSPSRWINSTLSNAAGDARKRRNNS